jgi:hypothetical protein
MIGCPPAHRQIRGQASQKAVSLVRVVAIHQYDTHYLIRVNTLVRFLVEQLAYRFLHRWHTSHTTNQDNLIDRRRIEIRVLECCFYWTKRAFD